MSKLIDAIKAGVSGAAQGALHGALGVEFDEDSQKASEYSYAFYLWKNDEEVLVIDETVLTAAETKAILVGIAFFRKIRKQISW